MLLSLFPVALLALATAAPAVPRRSTQWPRPASGYVVRTGTNICLDAAVKITLQGVTPLNENGKVLPTALEYLNNELKLTSNQAKCGSTSINEIVINLTGETRIGPSMAEDYTLTVSASEATISASSVWGARHAITTLHNMLEVHNTVPISSAHYTQTIAGDNAADFYFILPYGPQFQITDKPRLSHRGLMVDTSRHYIEYNILQRIIRTMARAKMNVLHWHATDDQSFPLVMTNSAATIHGSIDCNTNGICAGAYSNKMVYTHNQAKTLVEYARRHGVRVVLEIDQPSHARSWANRDNTLRECADLESQLPGFCHQPICGPLALSQNYDKVRQLANLINTDILDIVLPTEHIHIGMDEIGASCWGQDTRDLLTLKWLEDSLTDLLNRNGAVTRKVVLWQDGLHFSSNVTLPDIAVNTIGQIWTDPSEAQTFLENGRDVIWSNYHVMYLDCGRGNHAVFTNPSWCGEFKLWWDIYLESPDLTIPVTAKPGFVAGKVLGGEVALWGEQADSNNIEALLWPRATAWAGASWESRTTVPSTPNDTASITAAFAVEKNVISFNHMVAFLDSVPHTPVSIQWCAYEDESYCQRYAEFYFTSTTTTPRPSSAPRLLSSMLTLNFLTWALLGDY